MPPLIVFVDKTGLVQAPCPWAIVRIHHVAVNFHHAWLIEDLPGGRVRILTQETQIGNPAKELARTNPNPMLNRHQEWLDGLARTALARKHS
jgi:hypothetical protein